MKEKVKLTPRLKYITEYVRQDERVVDVGTDHGLIPIYLIQNDITDKVILSDINEGPLEKARGNIINAGITEELDIRLGDGIETVSKGEADKAIIAGMGGNLMIEIMSKDLGKSHSMEFVLQPRKRQERLSKWLYNNNFKIEDERLVKEGFYIWQIIHAVPKKEDRKKEREIDFSINPILIEKKDPLLLEFINQKIKVLREIERGAINGKGWVAAKNYIWARDLIAEMEKLSERIR